MEDRGPLCLKIQKFDIHKKSYLKFQNSERLVCEKCAKEIEENSRPTWQIISNRVFQKSLKNV